MRADIDLPTNFTHRNRVIQPFKGSFRHIGINQNHLVNGRFAWGTRIWSFFSVPILDVAKVANYIALPGRASPKKGVPRRSMNFFAKRYGLGMKR